MARSFGPSEAVVKEAVAGVAPRYPNVRAVIAHGSWVRGDFWPGQSDLDLITVTDWNVPERISPELAALGETLGLSVESWTLPEGNLEAWRILRETNPGYLTNNVQLDIAGFDVVDRHVVLWLASGTDPLANYPVPRGDDLRRAAAARLHRLSTEITSAKWKDEQANRIACDALKAVTILFLLKAGQQPTRDKRQIMEAFREVVPDAPGRRATAERIWELYRAGDKDGGVPHRAACLGFVLELVGLVRAL